MERNYDNFHIFIYRLLKEIKPDSNMTAECKDILNHMLKDIAIKYTTESVNLCRYAKKVTIDSGTINTLTNIWLTDAGDLHDFNQRIWETYSNNTNPNKGKRAGLNIQPSRIRKLFKEYQGINQQIGDTAVIFLTSTLEYIFKELLLVATSLTKKITISGVHIYTALKDFKYKKLFDNYFIAGFGNIY